MTCRVCYTLVQIAVAALPLGAAATTRDVQLEVFQQVELSQRLEFSRQLQLPAPPIIITSADGASVLQDFPTESMQAPQAFVSKKISESDTSLVFAPRNTLPPNVRGNGNDPRALISGGAFPSRKSGCSRLMRNAPGRA
jgi:hypothetical protein